MTRCMQISDEDWSEADAVIAYVTAHLPPGALLDMATIDKALSSRRTIRAALRWRVVALEKSVSEAKAALREAQAKIPPPPPPPRPRPQLVPADPTTGAATP